MPIIKSRSSFGEGCINTMHAGRLGISVVIVLIGVWLRVRLFDYGLPYLAHVDEPVFYLLANDWRGVLDAGWRNDYFAGYPPGYIWYTAGVLALVDAISNLNIHTQTAHYIAILRLVSMLSDVLGIAIMIALGRELVGWRAGWLAGGVWAVSQTIIYEGITVMPDIHAIMLSALCALLALKALRRQSAAIALLSTIAGLVAIIFKYPDFPILLLPAACFLYLLWRRPLAVLPHAAFALALVLATAYGLLVVYGAGSMDVSEGTQFRDNFFNNVSDLTRWRYTMNGIAGNLGGGLIITGAAAVLALVFYRGQINPRPRWPLIALLLAVGLVLMSVVPAYLNSTPPRVYPVRYTLHASVLLIPVFASVVVIAFQRPAFPRWLRVGAILLPIVAWLPQTLASIADLTRPHKYVAAQRWFEENVPADKRIWIYGYRTYVSLSRYEGGYQGYKDFPVTYEDEQIRWPQDADRVDYLYIDRGEFEDWLAGRNHPPLEHFTLVKSFQDPSYYGDDLFIYRIAPLPNPLQITFRQDDIAFNLRGWDVKQDKDAISIETYWQTIGARPTRDYSLFLHLTPIDDPTTIVAQYDTQLGQRPTSTWDDPQELLTGNPARLSLAGLPSGPYALRLGIYYWETLTRFTLDDGQDALLLTEITVP